MRTCALQIDAPAGPMGALLCTPAETPAPGALVLTDEFGATPRVRELASRLAAAGYAALAPNLYYRERHQGSVDDPRRFVNLVMRTVALSQAPEERVKDDRALADVRAALTALHARPEVAPGQVRLIGLSIGARVAFLAACRLGAAIGAAVCVCGARMVPVIEEVRDLHAPLLLMFGGRDPHVHRREIDRIRAELGHRGKLHRVSVFEEAGHAFLDPGRPDYSGDAAERAWTQLLDWLEQGSRS